MPALKRPQWSVDIASLASNRMFRLDVEKWQAQSS